MWNLGGCLFQMYVGKSSTIMVGDSLLDCGFYLSDGPAKT